MEEIGEFVVGIEVEKFDAAADLASDKRAWCVEVSSIIDCMDKPERPGIAAIGDNEGFPDSVGLSSSNCLLPAAAAAAAARFAAVSPKLPSPPCPPRGKGNGD